MARRPDPELLARNAAIIEYYVNNSSVPATYIADKYGISIGHLSKVLDLWFPYLFGTVLVLESGIDTPKAILQEIEMSFKENTSVLNITQ